MRSPEKVFGKRSKMKKINKITSCALKAWNTREGRERFWVISPPQDPLFWFLFSGMLQEPDVFCLDSVRQTWYERKIKARIIPFFLLMQLYLLVTWGDSVDHVIPGPPAVQLRQTLVFYTCEGASLVKRWAHKAPVTVHLHEFEYLTKRGTRDTVTYDSAMHHCRR